jgi:hypothetical protein
MRVLYYTAGVAGSGRIVQGLSIYNALVRQRLQAEFCLLSSSPLARLADRLGVPHAEIPLEDERQLSEQAWSTSKLCQFLSSYHPDILLVDLLWFPLHHFIRELPGKKVFLCRQIDARYFAIDSPDGCISFRPEDYDLLLATEPWDPPFPMRPINPIVIRNREEILSRSEALERLALPEGSSYCLFAFTGTAEDVAEVKQMFAYLGEEGYQMVYGSDYPAGLFPVVDYYQAFDYLICGAGYNAFWEAVYFQKEAYFIPRPRHFEDQYRRVAECQEYELDQNGADQLVEILAGL